MLRLRSPAPARAPRTGLLSADQRFRTAFEIAPVGMTVATPDGRWLQVNPAMCRMTGRSEAELLTGGVGLVTHPDDRPADHALVGRLMRGESTVERREKRYVRPDGSIVWCQLTAALVPDGGDGRPYIVSQVEDVTERRVQEAALRGHAEDLADIVDLQQAMLAADADTQATMDLVVERVRRLTNASGAVVELVEGADMVYAAVAGSAAAHLGLRLSRAGSLSGACVGGTVPIACHDTEDDLRVDRGACRRVGARSMLLAPLLVDGAALGVLKVLSNRPLAFTSRDERLLELMAGVTAAAIGRGRAADAQRRLVSELSVALADLREAETRIRDILHGAQDAFVSMDDAGRVTDWNPRAEASFGWSREEAVGRPVSELIIPEPLRAAHEHGLSRFLRTGEAKAVGRRLELPAIDREGREFPVELTITRTSSRHGHAFHAFLHDISARRDAERHRAALIDELERSNADLTTFAQSASHDLAAPLRLVSGYLALLRRRHGAALDEDAEALVTEAADACARMHDLIDDMLGYSRLNGALRWEPVALAAVAEEALATLAPDVEEAGAVVEIGPLPCVHGDHAQLGRLLQNLVGNAVKFRSQAPPHVRITARAVPGGQEIEVRDNGIGIPPGDAERVFDAFQRLDARGAYQGTGIGLASCKRIVERHGGTIDVRPAPGGGSVFRFTLCEAPPPRAAAV